jgi:aminoglycoside 3-N-acetyltransferase
MTEDEVSAYRRNMPGFDKGATPSTMGALGEALRRAEGAVRSEHPQSSFVAIGPEAKYLMADHRFDCHLGEHSPLAKLYSMSASLLLLGVGYSACSAFHLAEYRYSNSPPKMLYSCVAHVGGPARWIGYIDVVLDDQDFGEIGKDLESRRAILVKKGNMGNAESRLIPMVQAVDHARDWMAQHRT